MGKSHATSLDASVFRQYFATVSQALKGASTKFQRDRQLGPLQVMLTLQAAHVAGSQAGGQSWEDALASLVDELGSDSSWGGRFAVSRRAFQAALTKVNDADEQDLWAMCHALFPATSPSRISELHGIRFAHVDGTQVRTTRSAELVKAIGTQTNGPSSASHYPMGKCVVLLEAGTQRLLGYEFCRCKAIDEQADTRLPREEREGWRLIRDATGKQHAMIADCGFASYRDFADMIDQGQHFLIAVPKSWLLIKRFRAQKQADAVIDMPLPHHPDRTMKVRVFTIIDSDGNTRYIATSLTHPFSLSECRRLYKTRWSIEIWFRYAKQFLALRKLRSQTLRGVRLEFIAILIFMQAIAAIRTRIANHLNHIDNLLACVTDGFRKAKFRHAINAAWRIVCMALTGRPPSEPPAAFLRLAKTSVTYHTGRHEPRISHDPAGVFMPKRPSRSQRKADKRKKIDR